MSNATSGRGWPRSVKVGSVTVPVYRVVQDKEGKRCAYVVVWNTATGRKRQKFADPDTAMNEARLARGQ